MGRLRGFIWLAAGVVLALLAGLVAYATLTRVAQAPQEQEVTSAMVPVVVASYGIPVRTLLTVEHLQVVEMPADVVPSNAVRSVESAIGNITTMELSPGEPILTQRLLNPNVIAKNGRDALVLVEEQVLMAIPAQDLLSRVGVLKPGDHVDLLFSLDFPINRGVGASEGPNDTEQATFDLLQNVTIAALVGNIGVSEEEIASEAVQQSSLPDSVLVTLSPQDALTLKYVMDAGGIIDIVLRSPGVERPFTIDPVDVDYLINRYRIPTGPGR